MDPVTIVLPREHAQSLFHLVRTANVPTAQGKRAQADIMDAIEVALAPHSASSGQAAPEAGG